MISGMNQKFFLFFFGWGPLWDIQNSLKSDSGQVGGSDDMMTFPPRSGGFYQEDTREIRPSSW